MSTKKILEEWHIASANSELKHVHDNFIGIRERNPQKHAGDAFVDPSQPAEHCVMLCRGMVGFFLRDVGCVQKSATSGMGLAVTTSFCQIVRVELCHQYVYGIMTSFCL